MQAGGDAVEPRQISRCQQVEDRFTESEWRAFIRCARIVMERGCFLHNEFEAKRPKHPDVSERDIVNAVRVGSYLVAYQHGGMERVALWDPDRRNVVVIATLKDGVITAFAAPNFKASLSRATDVRWLWWPK